MKDRLAPFLALLDARYLPLLFAAAPQSYVVYLWLWRGSDHTTEAWVFAILGALGYEMVYVGAIAWAEGQTSGRWVWGTAITALVFSVAVACYAHRAQGWAALLHSGFPLTAFAYVMTIHSSGRRVDAPATLPNAENAHPVIHIDLTPLAAELRALAEPVLAPNVAPQPQFPPPTPNALLLSTETSAHQAQCCGAILTQQQAAAMNRWHTCKVCGARDAKAEKI